MKFILEWICHLPYGIASFFVFQFWAFCSLIFPDFGRITIQAAEDGLEEMRVLLQRREEGLQEQSRLLREAKEKWFKADAALDEAKQIRDSLKKSVGIRAVVAVCECGWERHMETHENVLDGTYYAYCYECRRVITNWKVLDDGVES